MYRATGGTPQHVQAYATAWSMLTLRNGVTLAHRTGLSVLSCERSSLRASCVVASLAVCPARSGRHPRTNSWGALATVWRLAQLVRDLRSQKNVVGRELLKKQFKTLSYFCRNKYMISGLSTFAGILHFKVHCFRDCCRLSGSWSWSV